MAATTVILDSGSSTLRAGISGDDAPSVAMPCVVGRPKLLPGALPSLRSSYMGQDALDRRGILKLVYPVESGYVSNWPDLEGLWKYAIEEKLQLHSGDVNVFVTAPYFAGAHISERGAYVLFENLNVQGAWFAHQGPLSLAAAGRTDGVVLDLGHQATYLSAVTEGSAIQKTALRVDMGGTNITHYLRGLLCQRMGDSALRSTADLVEVAKAKEAYAYVAEESIEEEESNYRHVPMPREHEMPDGTVLRLEQEQFRCTEALFQLGLIGLELGYAGVDGFVYNSCNRCDVSLQPTMYANILLAGGTSLLPGLASRLQFEVGRLAPSAMPVRVLAPPERAYSAWVGASIVTSLDDMTAKWITKAEFEEEGPTVARRCRVF